MNKIIKLFTVTSLSSLVSIAVFAENKIAPTGTAETPAKVEATKTNITKNKPAQNNKSYPPQTTNQATAPQGQGPMMGGRVPHGGMQMPMMMGHQGNMPMMGNQQGAMQMPMMRGPQGNIPMMVNQQRGMQMPMMGRPQGNMPMMGSQQKRMSMKQFKKMNKRKMRQQKQAKKEQQRKKMETHLANIEALLKELVELQKSKK